MAEIKQLQLLRSKDAFDNFATAKTKLTEKLGEDTVKDGEIITASYVKGASVHTLFGIKRKGASGTATDGESYFQDIEATAEEIQAAVRAITGGETAPEGVNLTTLNAAIEAEVTRAKAAEKANADAIAAMDLTDTPVDGEFITTVSQTDGKVTIARGKVASDKVTATAVTGDANTVAIEGANVDEQIKSLGKTLKTVQDNAAKYEVVKIATGLPANVRTRYQVVSYVGDSADATKTQVGANIDIPKDGQLLNVEPTANGQGIKFTYSAGDGAADKIVEIDLGKAIFESEIGHGLQVDSATGVVSVKKDTTSENYLSVGADGVKLAGIDAAITAAIDKLDVPDSEETGKYVSAVSETDGKIKVTRKAVAAEEVTLATVSEPEGTENPKALAATNVQAGVKELFEAIITNEKVSLDAKTALIEVLGANAVKPTADGKGYELKYNNDSTGILAGAGSFSEADEKLAAAIATLNATKVIDCGTY